MVVCEVLGAVRLDGSALSSSRQRRLLAALAVAHGDVVSSDRLVDVVWDGRPPPSSLNALQTYVSRLRAGLGASAIVLRPPGYALALPSDGVDAWRFEALVEVARAKSPSEALGVLDEALGLWNGPAYAEFAGDEFAQGEAVRLEELRGSAEVARLDALLALGRTDEVVAESLRLIETDPYREPLWERRMRALHATGRTVDAVRAFHGYRVMLAEETGLEPSADLTALERALVTASSPSEPPPTGLNAESFPEPYTTFRGRSVAVGRLVEILTVERVVTLVGPGGVGKTRLAVEAARAYREQHQSPAWFVELAPLSSGDVAAAVARAVGVVEGTDGLASLRRTLSGRTGLLVLDNCEHLVVAAAAFVDALVPFCPTVRVLATSRARLGASGETVWVVPPLPVPDPLGVTRLADLDGHASSRLFLDRAHASGVAIDDRAEVTRAVAAICGAVDGLPLGIELAAALARELPLTHVAAGLSASRTAPSPDRATTRHRSLDAAFRWGYDLLEPAVQRLVRLLAVFEGGWTIEAAEAVGAGDDASRDVTAVLATVVAASFATFTPSTGRYSMLETVRAFARTRSAEANETDAASDRHLDWYCRVVGEAASGLVGPAPGPVVGRLAAEDANLHAALAWAVGDGHRLDDAEQLAYDLRVYWAISGQSGAAVRWIRQILDRPAPATATRAALTLTLSEQLSVMGDFLGSAQACEAALSMARSVGDRRLVTQCLTTAAFFSVVDERADLAVEAHSIAQELGDAELAAAAIHMQGLLAARAGRGNDAVACYRTALATGRDSSHLLGTRYMLAVVLTSQGRWDAAHDELLIAEREYGEDGARTDASLVCLQLAQAELARGVLDGARRAMERAGVWGRPSDDFTAEQMVFDATGALVQASTGDIAGAAATARGVAAAPVDVSGHGVVCSAWLQAAEVLARAGDLRLARRGFTNILRHRSGRFPRDRALGLAGVAGTLIDQPRAAADLAATAAALSRRHGLVAPPWLTIARYDHGETPPALDPDEAVVLAITLDDRDATSGRQVRDFVV